MSLADDREAGAFGPVVRDQKIKNLTKYPFTRFTICLNSSKSLFYALPSLDKWHLFILFTTLYQSASCNV